MFCSTLLFMKYDWVLLLLVATVLLSFYNLLQKTSSPHIGKLVALPFVSVGVCIVTLIAILFQIRNPAGTEQFSLMGAFMAVGIGLFWALGQVFVFAMYKKGAPISIGLPLLLGGITLLVFLVSAVFLNEKITATRITGVVFMIMGYFVLYLS